MIYCGRGLCSISLLVFEPLCSLLFIEWAYLSRIYNEALESHRSNHFLHINDYYFTIDVENKAQGMWNKCFPKTKEKQRWHIFCTELLTLPVRECDLFFRSKIRVCVSFKLKRIFTTGTKCPLSYQFNERSLRDSSQKFAYV